MQPGIKLLKPRARLFAFAKSAFIAGDAAPQKLPTPAPEFRELQTDQRPAEPVDTSIAGTRLSNPLTVQETQNYLERELQDKGWKNDPEFEAPVFQLIHQFSEGVPKRINTICNFLLMQCFVEQRHRITLADARAIVEDLLLETSITYKPHSEELSVFLQQREATLEAHAALRLANNQNTAVELPEQESQPLSDTAASQSQKAHFESRNVSLPRHWARRGKW